MNLFLFRRWKSRTKMNSYQIKEPRLSDGVLFSDFDYITKMKMDDDKKLLLHTQKRMKEGFWVLFPDLN